MSMLETSAAAIDVMRGELTRRRFGPGFEAPMAWLGELQGPVRACYEAGPTGLGLHRQASAAGIEIEVVAPGKTPRGPSDRVKSDRKDAELLARLLMAGSLTAITMPSPEIEAARELTRLHDVSARSDARPPSRGQDAAAPKDGCIRQRRPGAARTANGWPASALTILGSSWPRPTY